MGLFDDVRCDYPLPDPRHNAMGFQTKDTDRIDGGCYLRMFHISREGRLELRDPDNTWIDQDYHGDLHIYEHDVERGEWVEYVVRFTEGTVSRLWRVDQEGNPYVAVEPSIGRGGQKVAKRTRTVASKPGVTGETTG